jgi:glycine cleavage system H protein
MSAQPSASLVSITGNEGSGMSDLRYTAEHEWVRQTDAGTIIFGITDYAQQALGDIVFLTLPNVGEMVQAGESCGEVESTKSVSDIYAPLTGEVLARNDALVQTPETINTDAYGQGWLVELQPSDLNQFDQLLTAGEYEALTSGK